MNARASSPVLGIAFDLDGTLIDTVPDLSRAAVAMLEALELPSVDEGRIVGFVGGGIEALVEQTLVASTGHPASARSLHAATRAFRVLYGRHLFDRGRVYEGVRAGLDTLRASKLRLCCVTNKASAFTRPLLAAAGLETGFERVLCADRAEQRKPRPDLLREACARFAIEPRQLLMVGDSTTDVGAARAAGCPVAAVNYGYGTRQLVDAGWRPDWFIDSLTDIATLPPLAWLQDRNASWTGD